MKYIKTFEKIKELPKFIDIDSELNQLRELKKEQDNIKTSDYIDIHDKISSKEYQTICDKEDIIEKKIKSKIYPIMMKYLDVADFEGAKWFVGNSYKDMNTLGKTLLFRIILMKEDELLNKYNL